MKKWMTMFALTTAVASVHAEDPIYKGIFSDKAVGGYDTVAYFTDGKAVKGDSKYWTEYMGATWLFKTPEHLVAFKADPARYAPQYGGYCAFALGSANKLVSADPEQWDIVDGRLYLNYDKNARSAWLKSQAHFIVKANENWSAKFGKERAL